jgi:thiol-disulfide isomerase/thioredoxin
MNDIPDGERRPLSRRAAWLVVGALAVILTALWFATDRRQGAGTAPSQSADDGPRAEPGMPAPLQFTLKDLSGRDVALSSFKGKVILLNFWATWCEPCKAEIPDLVALQQEYGDRLAVVGMLMLDPVGAETRPFVERFKMSYPVLNANDRVDIEDAFGPMWGLPTSVLVGPDGRVAARYSGPRTKTQFERDIKPLL